MIGLGDASVTPEILTSPTLGENSQAFGWLNIAFAARKHRNHRNPPFFEFGTVDAEYLASPGWTRKTPQDTNRRLHMYANETANRFFAAAFSVVISAAFFAYAIIPASPSLVA